MVESNFDGPKLQRELKAEARALGIPVGAAESFAELIAKAVAQRLESKAIITDSDLARAIAKESKKYSADLAYVYENRDKIV